MNLKYKSYIEKKQLGTIGALSLMQTITRKFFITNCDILIMQTMMKFSNFI